MLDNEPKYFHVLYFLFIYSISIFKFFSLLLCVKCFNSLFFCFFLVQQKKFFPFASFESVLLLLCQMAGIIVVFIKNLSLSVLLSAALKRSHCWVQYLFNEPVIPDKCETRICCEKILIKTAYLYINKHIIKIKTIFFDLFLCVYWVFATSSKWHFEKREIFEWNKYFLTILNVYL